MFLSLFCKKKLNLNVIQIHHRFISHMTHVVDIPEIELLKDYSEAFEVLLMDHTTGENIYWACDSYKERGEGYQFFSFITIPRITGDDNGYVIRPRAVKLSSEQLQRTKDKAEVFTPCWVCNAQNNLVDNAWFGYEGAFNREFIDESGMHKWTPLEGKIFFSGKKGRTWKDYIASVRMEITCGEAPYLVSRYDTTDGRLIPLEMRIGLLDRKLRVINENSRDRLNWKKYAQIALKTTYGYEWQGDSLLIARENLLYSVIDYYEARFKEAPDEGFIKECANIISWNIWQMDGLTFGLPGYTVKEQLLSEDSLFSSDDFNDGLKPQERFCVIMDWRENKSITFKSLNVDINRP